MELVLRRLVRNAELSGIGNLSAHRLAMWDSSEVELHLEGPPALASVSISGSVDRSETVSSVAIDDYIASERLDPVGIGSGTL